MYLVWKPAYEIARSDDNQRFDDVLLRFFVLPVHRIITACRNFAKYALSSNLRYLRTGD